MSVNSGEIAWRVPLGSYRELEEKGIKGTGAPNLGGPIVTAAGLVFIGATNDRRFRAFDSKTGKELWVQDMPGQAMAVPITYKAGDNQYVAVATGGPGLLSSVFPRGGPDVNGTIVAFGLPR